MSYGVTELLPADGGMRPARLSQAVGSSPTLSACAPSWRPMDLASQLSMTLRLTEEHLRAQRPKGSPQAEPDNDNFSSLLPSKNRGDLLNSFLHID